MESIDVLRFASRCVLLSGAETLHGIARTVLLAPGVGKASAIRFSIVTGNLLAFGLASFMAAVDVAIGKFVMRFKWARIWQDFNPSHGNDLSIGLVLLVFIPAAVWWLRGSSAT